MAKRLSDNEKEEMVKCFIVGQSIEELAKKFNFTKLTIVRNLKKNLGEKKYEELIHKTIKDNNNIDKNEKDLSFDYRDDLNKKLQIEKFPKEKVLNINTQEDLSSVTPFMEIAPLNFEIENLTQKDLSSIPIAEMHFPKIVYMIVDKKIELEIKLLREYADWQFLAEEELNRKTIEIYIDLKVAKRFCRKEQKVIKVPNSDVFKIASPQLIAKGISRIVSSDKLIAL